jgi:hypothetical protein
LKCIIAVVNLTAASAQATIVNLAATLNTNSQPVEIQTSNGFGSAAMAVDTDNGNFASPFSFGQLTGPVSLAHFHVAPVGINGPVVLDLASNAGVDLSGIGAAERIFSGSAQLSTAPVDEMLNGLWYNDIHIDLNPTGEIRSQVYPGEFVPSAVRVPAPLALLASGVVALSTVARRRIADARH